MNNISSRMLCLINISDHRCLIVEKQFFTLRKKVYPLYVSTVFLFFISKKHILFFKRMWSVAQDSHIHNTEPHLSPGNRSEAYTYSLKSTHSSVLYVYVHVLWSKNISLYMYSDLQVHISVWFNMRGMSFDQKKMISKKRGALPN
jgi:hypothetical protein